jgi:hypothetical protein
MTDEIKWCCREALPVRWTPTFGVSCCRTIPTGVHQADAILSISNDRQPSAAKSDGLQDAA